MKHQVAHRSFSSLSEKRRFNQQNNIDIGSPLGRINFIVNELNSITSDGRHNSFTKSHCKSIKERSEKPQVTPPSMSLSLKSSSSTATKHYYDTALQEETESIGSTCAVAKQAQNISTESDIENEKHESVKEACQNRCHSLYCCMFRILITLTMIVVLLTVAYLLIITK